MNTYSCLLVPQAFSYSSERLFVFTSASGAFTWAWTEASPPSWQIQMSALWKTATLGLAAWVIWETLLQCFGSSASMHSSPDFSSFTMPLLQRNLGGQADQQCQGPDPKWPEMTIHQTSATLSWTCKQRQSRAEKLSSDTSAFALLYFHVYITHYHWWIYMHGQRNSNKSASLRPGLWCLGLSSWQAVHNESRWKKLACYNSTAPLDPSNMQHAFFPAEEEKYVC